MNGWMQSLLHLENVKICMSKYDIVYTNIRLSLSTGKYKFTNGLIIELGRFIINTPSNNMLIIRCF